MEKKRCSTYLSAALGVGRQPVGIGWAILMRGDHREEFHGRVQWFVGTAVGRTPSTRIDDVKPGLKR
jgi:hypothetical protein